jgi:hypothetical protein
VQGQGLGRKGLVPALAAAQGLQQGLHWRVRMLRCKFWNAHLN